MEQLKTLAKAIYEKNYRGSNHFICKKQCTNLLDNIIGILFPQFGQEYYSNEVEIEQNLVQIHFDLILLLTCSKNFQDISIEELKIIADQFVTVGFKELFEKLTKDAEFILENDPAAISIDEVITCYPGFYAICTHRIAHFFYLKKVKVLPRILSELAHEKTGIDIHPGAKIGSPFFIDHGTGIVIGETTEIGNRVKIFQGVTLGALSVKRTFQNQKRHPTIEDDCVIYSNASILGGETIIGKNTIIGGNVWLTHSVPESSQVLTNSEQIITSRNHPPIEKL